MRILYFHQHFTTPDVGGGTRSYEFSKKLIDKGHNVTMVCGKTVNLNLSNNDSKFLNRDKIDGIDIIQLNLKYSNKDSVYKRLVTFLKFAYYGIKLSLDEEYDLLFASSTPLTAGIPGIWIKIFKRKETKFIFEVRDLWPELPKALGLKNPFLLIGMSFLEKLTYKKSDAIIGLSPGICDGIKKKVEKNKPITMIPNGCDLNIFTPIQKKTIQLKDISNSDFVAVFSGAHGIANGLDILLDTANELMKRNRTDIKILLIGDGKMKSSLVHRSRKEKLTNCIFYNSVSKIKLNNIFSICSVGLMILKNVPEFYYGTSPNKFFDYISAGLPVINNYPGWIAEIIKNNKCGEIVSPDNSYEFANILEKLADDSQLCKKYGINSRKLAENKFSRDYFAKSFVDFLEKNNNLNRN